MKEEFAARNRARWRAAIGKAFGNAPPQSAQCTALDEMVRVLTPFMGENLNHTMMPGGGGFDMDGIARARELACLEFSSSPKCVTVFRPAVLFFEHLSDSPWNSFFLVETRPLEASGVYGGDETTYEEVLEVAPGKYVSRGHLDEGHMGYDEEGREIPLPEGNRLVCRYMTGRFLIVAKASLWNLVSATYDGRHDSMSAAEIRRQIEREIAGGKGISREHRKRDG
jgi:serine/threonine-protein kinase